MNPVTSSSFCIGDVMTVIRIVRSRPAPLANDDRFVPGLFGARWAGGRDPRDLARADHSAHTTDFRGATLDADGTWRWRVPA